MAIWRYFALKCSNQSTSFCTFRRCYRVIGAAYICPLFLCILNYLYFQIHAKVRFETALQPSLDSIDEEDQRKMRDFLIVCQGLNELSFSDRDYCEKKNITLYTVEMSELARDYPILHKMHFWTFSVIIKLIPCVVLTFFMCWLVNVSYMFNNFFYFLYTNYLSKIRTLKESKLFSSNSQEKIQFCF